MIIVHLWCLLTMSYNSGNTYTLLKGNTPNDGAELLPVPTVTNSINTCRIKVESKNSIFYDVSNNDFTISTDVLAGINEGSLDNSVSLSVWPNPSEIELNYSASNLNNEGNTEIQLFDILGRIVVTRAYLNVDKINDRITLSELSPGVYFISIRNKDQLHIQKMIKN